jgi:hypothetical protein
MKHTEMKTGRSVFALPAKFGIINFTCRKKFRMSTETSMRLAPASMAFKASSSMAQVKVGAITWPLILPETDVFNGRILSSAWLLKALGWFVLSQSMFAISCACLLNKWGKCQSQPRLEAGGRLIFASMHSSSIHA